MNPIRKAFERLSASARADRARLFRECFDLDIYTKVLDLGSEDGTNIASILEGTEVRPANVFIADIDREALERGKERFGFSPAYIKEGERLPFDERYFDIVYCSSVIEHVTGPKARIWEIKSDREFRSRAWERQTAFAADIQRVGRQYFVQTPCRSFPIESHTWLPLVGILPRWILIPVMKAANAVWIKRSIPDFNLLSPLEMQKLFPEARIELETRSGMTKSIMAIRSNKPGKTESDVGKEEI